MSDKSITALLQDLADDTYTKTHRKVCEYRVAPDVQARMVAELEREGFVIAADTPLAVRGVRVRPDADCPPGSVYARVSPFTRTTREWSEEP